MHIARFELISSRTAACGASSVDDGDRCFQAAAKYQMCSWPRGSDLPAAVISNLRSRPSSESGCSMFTTLGGWAVIYSAHKMKRIKTQRGSLQYPNVADILCDAVRDIKSAARLLSRL